MGCVTALPHFHRLSEHPNIAKAGVGVTLTEEMGNSVTIGEFLLHFLRCGYFSTAKV